jgi:hypothetical protein
MKGKFARIKSGFGREVVAALYQETQIETTEVKRRTPVDTGELRASVHVVGPFSQGDRIWTLIACGGLAAKYAVYVHENLEAFHKVGQAKFLESVILESRPFMAKRVADRISLNRALAGGQ